MIIDKNNLGIITQRTIVSLGQEALEKDGIVRLQVKGNCMLPLVRDKDIVFVRAIPVDQLRIGDIAVYRISEEGLHVYVNCGKPPKVDTRVFLGKVLAIERGNGKLIMQGGLRRLRNMLWLPWYLQQALLRKLLAKPN